eukprot:TRINITY_DN74299_c0_g1_i1.p1 TRINITY_DN74299_c0_g1~~TRINITY_DN74299_c0_g1_i1.p1  ORF type:complete len:276 (-),score=58.18 TRINITY_DN74299_c0_g1_i1:30-857(-)
MSDGSAGAAGSSATASAGAASAPQAPLVDDKGDGLKGSSVEVRHQWARKVFGVIGCQLISMVGIAALVMMDGESWVKSSPDMALTLVAAASMGVVCMMLTFMILPAYMLKRFPDNYILLCLFTALTGVLVGLLCLRFAVDSLLVGVGVVSFIVAALSSFACQTSADFLDRGPYTFVNVLTFTAFCLMYCTGTALHAYEGESALATFSMSNLATTCFLALLVLWFIVYDMQLIMLGTHFDQFGKNDYVAAAIHVYVDPILLCLYCCCGRRPVPGAS